MNSSRFLRKHDTSSTPAILKLETQHFDVRLEEGLLKIDLKGSLKNEIEEALENKPILRETIGGILSLFVPLHVRLADIDSVHVDETGKVKICLPHHRDILIPLEHNDAERLSSTLNELIPRAREEERKRIIKRRRTMLQKRQGKPERGRHVPPSSYSTMPWYFPTEQVNDVPKLKPRKREGAFAKTNFLCGLQ